jgi:hypothetical protein
MPDHTDAYVDPESLAVIGVADWLREDEAAAEEHEEAMRADTYRRETLRRKDAAVRALADARARLSNLMDKLDLEGRRNLGFSGGAAIVTGLVALDAIPLNWAAQAFGLNAADSWLVTLIMLVASVGAMAGLEVTRKDARRHVILLGITLSAYGGLVALRASFLLTVAGETLASALLQAVVLSAVSASLVGLGTVIMGRTRPFGLSRARAAARRAHRASEDSSEEWRRAGDRLDRHLLVLRRQLARQPLYSAAPAGMTHPDWVAALERALHGQFADR